MQNVSHLRHADKTVENIKTHAIIKIILDLYTIRSIYKDYAICTNDTFASTVNRIPLLQSQ